MDAADNDLTALQWSRIRAAWGGCAYCGAVDVSLQRDCVLPLSRGGRYTVENIVPACRSCNASKSNDEVTTWLRRKKLDERTFLIRHRAYLDSLARLEEGTDESGSGEDYGGEHPDTGPQGETIATKVGLSPAG